jgi:hypothetical protein
VTVTSRLFLSSTAFGAVIAIVYWSTTHERTGTILLGIFGAGFLWVAGYLLVTRRRTPLDGDGARTPADLAGERIGIFTTASRWPILLALAATGTAVGFVLHPMLGVLSFAALLAVIWQLVRESTGTARPPR